MGSSRSAGVGSPTHSLTRDVPLLVLLMGTWAICTGVLVEAMLSDVVLTSMVVLLGTFGVSAAVVTTRLQVEPVRDAPIPPPAA